jgi:multidrug efflux pump subunit AcrB
VNRYGRQRQITLLANAAPGAGESDVIDTMQKAFQELRLPTGYGLSPTGKSKSSAETGPSVLFAVGLAFVFMYLILSAQFESWLYPMIILSSLPLTVPFAFLSLLIFGQGLNLFSMLGLLVLFGVVKKNSILQVDHANHLRRQGRGRFESLIEANRDRLRPILMTTLAFVAGMLPLLLPSGIGAGFNKATASIVVGGQSLSLLLTLLAVPVFHSWVDDLGDLLARLRRTRGKRDRGERDVAAAILAAEDQVDVIAG